MLDKNYLKFYYILKYLQRNFLFKNLKIFQKTFDNPVKIKMF